MPSFPLRHARAWARSSEIGIPKGGSWQITRSRRQPLNRPERARHKWLLGLLLIADLPAWRIRTATAPDFNAILSLWLEAGISPGVSDTDEGLSSLLARE